MGILSSPQSAFMLPQPQQVPMQNVAPASPFTWGAGGVQLTPEELARKHAIAQELLKSNYSPVGSVWEGLGRVADNVLGALKERKLDKQDAAAAARSNAVAQALIGGGGGDIAAQAIVDPYVDENTRKLALLQYKQAHPDPVNNDTAADYAFWQQHMTPKQFNTWVQNKADPPQYRQGPDGQFYRIAPTAAPKPVTMDDWNSAKPIGDGAGNGTGGFHVPSGNPLTPYVRP